MKEFLSNVISVAVGNIIAFLVILVLAGVVLQEFVRDVRDQQEQANEEARKEIEKSRDELAAAAAEVQRSWQSVRDKWNEREEETPAQIPVTEKEERTSYDFVEVRRVIIYGDDRDGVKVELLNNGDRPLDEIRISLFLKDANGIVVSEKKDRLLRFLPIEPGSKTMNTLEPGVTCIRNSLPSGNAVSWARAEDSVTVKVTGVRFSE